MKSWDNKTPGANILMHELTGEDTYGQKIGQYLQSLKNGQKTEVCNKKETTGL